MTSQTFLVFKQQHLEEHRLVLRESSGTGGSRSRASAKVESQDTMTEVKHFLKGSRLSHFSSFCLLHGFCLCQEPSFQEQNMRLCKASLFN